MSGYICNSGNYGFWSKDQMNMFLRLEFNDFNSLCAPGKLWKFEVPTPYGSWGMAVPVVANREKQKTERNADG